MVVLWISIAGIAITLLLFGIFKIWQGLQLREDEDEAEIKRAIASKYGTKDEAAIRVLRLLSDRIAMHRLYDELSLFVQPKDEERREYPILTELRSAELGVLARITLPRQMSFDYFQRRLEGAGDFFEDAIYTNLSSKAIGKAEIEIITREAGADDVSLADLPSPTENLAYFAESWSGSPVAFSPLSHHTLISGVTRSGKSQAAMAILMQVTKMPTPVRIVGIDPGHGLLLPFANQSHIHLGSSPKTVSEFGETLGWVIEEMERRFALFCKLKRAKLQRSDLTTNMPALIVVIDELQSVMEALNGLGRAERDRIQSDLSRILREGSKGMIHVLAIQQRAEAKVVADRAQYTRKIAFRQDNPDGVKMMLPSASASQVETLLHAQTGRGYMSDPENQIQGITVPFFTEQTYILAIESALRGGTNE